MGLGKINTKWIKGSVAVILAVFLLLVWLWAEDAEAETVMEVGPAIVSDKFTHTITFILQERFKDGKYALAIGHIGEQDTRVGKIDRVTFVGAERIIKPNFGNFLDKIHLSIGAYYFNDVNLISSSHLNLRLALDYQLTERLTLKLSHFSNGGSGEGLEVNRPCYCPKGAQCKPCPVPKRNQANLGYDALLVTWRF